mmetsp:Transcript_21021/g.53806  ORF Transcript_21021/g.53806 Transcript_21021/m.53806 type:complete len:378 (+) Transcript_21021:194-1327(+)
MLCAVLTPLVSSWLLPTVRLPVADRCCTIKACAAPEDRESMIDALFTDDSEEAEAYDTSIPSSARLEYDEDTGEPKLARFTYVEEDTCIGCKNCALVARNTFFMEDDFGKARVFNQGGDSEEDIAVAIDTCPVNCIHYVCHEDLIILEQERLAREGEVDINNYGSFKGAWIGQAANLPETKAKYYNSMAMGVRCNNCPSRGCKECPMFGVGENPMYLQRVEERRLKREASGEAAAERADQERSAIIGDFLSEYAEPVAGTAQESEEKRVQPVAEAVAAEATSAAKAEAAAVGKDGIDDDDDATTANSSSITPVEPVPMQGVVEPTLGMSVDGTEDGDADGVFAEAEDEAVRQEALNALFSSGYAFDSLDDDDEDVTP